MKLTVEMIDAGARAIYAHEPFTWGDDSHVYETIATADRAQLRAIAAVAIEAALAVAPDPAPDNAEFETALDVLITQAEFLGSVRDTSTRDDVEHVRAARQRILALHRQATHAGLRELSAWIDIDVEAIPENKRGPFAVVAVAAMRRVQGQIDAMLTGKE